MSGVTEELNFLADQSLRRDLRVISQSEGSRITLDDKTYINFASNNYLGLARHPQVIEAAKQVLDHWGTGATSSRLISGSTIIHQDLESALSAYLRTEGALLFPSGYQANLGVITALAGPGDAVIIDRLCHASIVDAARLSGARLFVYGHRDVSAARATLERAASYRRRVLVTESLFSMDGDFAPIAELSALAEEYRAWFVIDKAHAIGLYADPPIRRPSDTVIVGTLSKALGSQGGFVCGSRDFIQLLVNKARSFIYTTGLSPVCIAAAFAALSLIQESDSAAQKVHGLSARLREGLNAQGFNTLESKSQIVPILLGSAERALNVATQLKEAGFFAPAIRPPTVHAGECRIRFSVTSDHSEKDIDDLIQAVRGNHE